MIYETANGHSGGEPPSEARLRHEKVTGVLRTLSGLKLLREELGMSLDLNALLDDPMFEHWLSVNKGELKLARMADAKHALNSSLSEETVAATSGVFENCLSDLARNLHGAPGVSRPRQ